MKSKILKLRKKIFKNLKSRAFAYEDTNKELIRYQKDQNQYSKRSFTISDMDTLSSKVLKSDIIYLGDFHTFDQNIRNVLRIVKILITQDTNLILGLEMVSSKHQFYLDAYLERHLTDLEFLECINYNTSWRFPWSHYKLIFQLAKKHQLKVLGLNTGGKLKERDLFAANLLSKTAQSDKSAKLLVLYGELHIVPNKIPQLISQLHPEMKYTIIHQNLDEVYWKLIKEDKEEGIISFNENEFCINSAPPWIKYESMIYWYENLVDDPDFDIHEYIIETGAKIFTDDTQEGFLNICLDLIGHLDLEIESDYIEDFNLYDHTQLEFIEKKLHKKLPTVLFNFYQELLTNNFSFRLPIQPIFYCSSYSMNRMAYLAGIHILHYFFKKNKIDTLAILCSKSSTKKFILFCYEAVIAYFFSKIINPHRKCNMYKDLISSDEISQAELAIKILNTNKISLHLTGTKIKDYHNAALIVGHILGEYLYQKAYNKSNQEKLDLSFTKISNKDFCLFKNNLLSEFKYLEHSKRYF